MIHTVIDKHEIFNSIFNMIAISTFNKKFAEQIRKDFSIQDDQNEKIPEVYKKEIVIFMWIISSQYLLDLAILYFIYFYLNVSTDIYIFII